MPQGRDPDVIQREIEQTRAELADTIDAIADRLSPKRAASRGASAVKAHVTSVLDRGSDDEPPAGVLDAPAGSHPSVPASSAAAGGSHFTGITQFAVDRRLRTDRVLLVVGLGAAVAGAIVLRRSRH